MGDGHGRKGSCPVLPTSPHVTQNVSHHIGKTYGLLYTSGRQTACTMVIVLVIAIIMKLMMMLIMTMIMIILMYNMLQLIWIFS